MDDYVEEALRQDHGLITDTLDPVGNQIAITGASENLCDANDPCAASDEESVQAALPDDRSEAIHTLARCHDRATEFEEWLLGLDGGRGVMLQYLEPLQREFENLFQLAASVTAAPAGLSVTAAVDPLVYEVLGIRLTGHKLLLAKGLIAVAEWHA